MSKRVKTTSQMYPSNESTIDNFTKAKRELLVDIPPIKLRPEAGEAKLIEKSIDFENIVSLDIESRYKKIKSSTKNQIIPLMVSYRTKDQKIDNNRAGLDLVFVIDVSGSMEGEKIKLVRETLLFIIDELHERDRVCLIKFDDVSTILTNLSPMTTELKVKFKEIIEKEIVSGNQTNIRIAIEDAYHVLLNRKNINDITSIFLLSDGQDNKGNKIEDFEKTMDEYDHLMKDKSMDYKINSFGYGYNHDEKVLGCISNYKQGSFYYIKKIKQIDEFFIECLGVLLSIFATKAEITVFLDNAKFNTKYGTKWDKQTTIGKGNISVGNLSAGIEKNFMAQIEIPPTSSLSGKVNFGQVVITFEVKDKSFIVKSDFVLEVTKSGNLGKINSKVEEHLIRVEAVELMKKTKEEFDNEDIDGDEARETIRKFKRNVKLNKHVSKEFYDILDGLLEVEICEEDKDFDQVEEILSDQGGCGGRRCFREENEVQRSLKFKRKIVI
jgi:Mg-chelatase subunit ChlD